MVQTARLGLALVLLGLTAGCDSSVSLPPPEQSPQVHPATSEQAPFSARLAEILPLADVETETRRIDFAALTDLSPLGSGWALEPTLGQGWGTGSRSELSFTVMPVRNLTLSLRCAPFHFAGSPRQFLTLRVNGHEVERLRLWNMMRGYTLEIPAEVLEFGPNELEFEYAHSSVPAEVLEDSDDGRHLAVLFELIRLGPKETSIAEPPTASADGTRLDLPFSTRVSYFLELGTDSRLRIGSVELLDGLRGDGLNGDGPSRERPGRDEAEWRLRLEAQVDGSDLVERVDLAPGQLDTPIEMVLPVLSTGQRARVSLAAYTSDPSPAGSAGLRLDLPEVISFDEALAARWTGSDGTEAAPAATSQPNVLVYMIDTLRADHLGSYGYERPTSPEIDAFAADATLFRNVVAQAPWTKPAVASILTGLNPQLHGVNRRKDALSPKAVTLAEELWEDGYDTAAIYTNGNLSHMGLGQGYAHYKHLRERDSRDIHVLSDQLNVEAFEWLRRRDRSKPFFLYLHATDPHSPYTPTQESLDRLGVEVDDLDAGLIDNVKNLRRNVVNEQQLADLIALYDAEISFNDQSFGELLDELGRQGLLDSTLIVLVSDHGEEFFDHGWWQHGKTLFQEQLGVPLIMRFPGGEGAGRVVDSLAQQVDVFPTVLDVAGITPRESLPGRSLRPLAQGDTWATPPNAISYLDLDNRTAQSVRASIGKLILHHFDVGLDELLFDPQLDPGELENLIAERPVLAGYLRTALRAFDLAQEIRLTPERGEFDAELTERLKALGYLN